MRLVRKQGHRHYDGDCINTRWLIRGSSCGNDQFASVSRLHAFFPSTFLNERRNANRTRNFYANILFFYFRKFYKLFNGVFCFKFYSTTRVIEYFLCIRFWSLACSFIQCLEKWFITIIVFYYPARKTFCMYVCLKVSIIFYGYFPWCIFVTSPLQKRRKQKS